MTKRNVFFQDNKGNELFKEIVFYTDLPPIGRKIEWHFATWVVHDILESWDNEKITVTLKPVEEVVESSKINLLDYLPKRPATAVASYLSYEKRLSDVNYFWSKEEIKSIDRNEIKKWRNFGEKSQKQLREFLEQLNN